MPDGATDLISRTQTNTINKDPPMNNVEKIFDQNPAKFAGSYFDYLHEILKSIDSNEISGFVNTLLSAREREATIFFIGNGGSASTASHFANDLVIGTKTKSKHFRVVALTDNNAVITAIGNDFGYEDIFERQIKVLGKSGDVVVAISASGNSPNLLKAFKTASDMNIKTVALTAFDGGKMREIADEKLHVPTDLKEYGPAEDAHLVLNHVVVGYLMQALRSES